MGVFSALKPGIYIGVPSTSPDTVQARAREFFSLDTAASVLDIVGKHRKVKPILLYMETMKVLKEMHMDLRSNLLSGDIAEAEFERSLGITYDPYTESILAEVMSSQQTESKLESAPRFIRPKKKKKILYK